MTETALSEAAMRQSLLDIRQPTVDAAAGFAELVLAAGLGGAAALVFVAMLQLVTRRRAKPRQVTLAGRIAALQSLPTDARRVAFLHLLREIAPERHAELRQNLYRPDAAVDAEAEVLARV